ncbi:MAG TPA: hypothetical protein VFP93_03070, partial [Gammaproteobacteria bacterium]|nr:hypothetical protein [Gammaproteobacteria bacterium]
MSLSFSSQTFTHEALQNLIKRIGTQNQCMILRGRQTGWNPFYFAAKHLRLLYLRIIRWGWDLGPEQPIASLTLKSVRFSPGQCNALFKTLSPQVQKKIALIDVNIDSQSLNTLIQQLIE